MYKMYKSLQLKKCQNTQSDTFITFIQSLAFVGFSVRLNKLYKFCIVVAAKTFRQLASKRHSKFMLMHLK